MTLTRGRGSEVQKILPTSRVNGPLRGLPGVVIEAHVVVAAVVLELLPVLAVFARGQQDDVVAVVQVVQRVAEKGRKTITSRQICQECRMREGTYYFFVRSCVNSATWLLCSRNL